MNAFPGNAGTTIYIKYINIISWLKIRAAHIFCVICRRICLVNENVAPEVRKLNRNQFND